MRRALLAVLAASVVAAHPAVGQVEVQAALSRDTVALDQSVEYRLRVSGPGLKEVEEPRLELPAGLTLFGQSRSSEVSIVNGAMERQVTFTLVYRPFRTGTIPIGPATVRVGSERYAAGPVTVTVVEARSLVDAPPPSGEAKRDSAAREWDRGDLGGAPAAEERGVGLPPVFVTNRLDRDEVYVGEQVVLTFAFYQSARSVVLDQPNYASAKTAGFWTQDFNREPEIARELIAGEPYTIQRFHYALFPFTAGEKEIPPATLTLTLRNPGSFLSRGRTRTLAGDTLRLKVRPLPETGRPAGFDGPVGRYALEARVEPRELERDAPATLVLTVSGEGNIATVPDPRLVAPSGVKVFEPEVKARVEPRGFSVRGEKEFRYLIIPKRSGRLDLGEASLDYFDPEAGAYRRVAADLGSLAVSGWSGPARAGEQPAGAVLAGLRPGPLRAPAAAPWTSPLYWLLAVLPVVELALLAAWRRRTRRQAAASAPSRRTAPARPPAGARRALPPAATAGAVRPPATTPRAARDTAGPAAGPGPFLTEPASSASRPARERAPLPSAEDLRRDPGPGNAARVERELLTYLERCYGVALAGCSLSQRERALREAEASAETAARAAAALEALQALAFAPPLARSTALEEALEALERLAQVEGARRVAAPRR